MATTHPISQPSGGDNTPQHPKAGNQPASTASTQYVESLSKQVGAGTGKPMTNAEASERVDELRDQRDLQRPGDGSGTDPTSTPDASNQVKDPKTWTTGGEPMTGAQQSYLKTLSTEAGVDFDASLNKAEASEQIDTLRQGNPRVQNTK